MWPFIVIIVLFIWYIRRRRHMTLLKRNGIPGPEPHLLFGYLMDAKVSTIERQKNLIKQYGKIVGVYAGAQPMVLVADPDLAKLVQIKDFCNFSDRPLAFRELYPGKNYDSIINFSRGDRWKQIRRLHNPIFSSAKLKGLNDVMDDSINTFLHTIEQMSKTGQEFNIEHLFQVLTNDVLYRTLFGIKFHEQKGSLKYLKAMNQLLKMRINKWVYLLISIFPVTNHLVNPLRILLVKINGLFGRSPYLIITEMIGNIIKLRKENPSLRKDDIMQTLIETSLNDKDLSEESNADSEFKSPSFKNIHANKITLTESEIQDNGVFLYGGAYETMNVTLSFVTHILIKYPHIQDNIRNEIQDVLKAGGNLNYNTIQNLHYMDKVMKETLRLFPPALYTISRQCLSDYMYKDMTIPKGATVVIPPYILHHDPDYWVDPETFNPMRFNAECTHEIHPSSWQPFGSGPRSCVGMRFAWFEMKLCLAKLILNYKLECGPNTYLGDEPYIIKAFTITPKNGVNLKVTKI